MKYEELNNKIIELVGGKENIESAAHCVTRLRLGLKDVDKAKTEEIKKLDGVLDVIVNNVAYQIVIGTHVTAVFDEFIQMIGIDSNAKTKTEKKKDLSVKGILNSALVAVSETMTKIITAMLLAGIVGSILAILTMTGLVSDTSSTYAILSAINTGVFAFLPIFIAFSAAERMNINPYVAVVIAITLLSDSINGVAGLNFLGIPLATITYSNTFIPMMLAVALLAVVTRFLEKHIPNALQFFFVPVLSVLIVLPITLIFFGPIGLWIGNILSAFFTFLSSTVGNWLAVSIYAAFQPFLTLTGSAAFVNPMILNFLAIDGTDPIFLGAATISDIAVAGAMLGYFLRAKQAEQKELFGTLSFSALMGVTEPAIYGAFTRFRKPFIAVIIGGGIGGLIAGLAGVVTYGYVWGLTGLPTYISGGTHNLVWMLIAVVVAFVVAAISSFVLGIPSEEAESKEETKPQPKKNNTGIENVEIPACVEGTIVSLDTVSDAAFASGALGKGCAIVPNDKVSAVTSPVDGTISVLFPTKHAVGITTDEGIELLIHVGMDTVNLNGEGFTTFVNQGDRVTKGQKLIEFDVPKIKKEGFDPTVMVVVTNTNEFLDVLETFKTNEDQCLKVVL